MARVEDNSFTDGTSGKTGKDMVFKIINGKTFLTKAPDRSKVVYVKEQKAYQKLFKAAAKYASSVKFDPEKAAQYLQKGVPQNSLYHAALQDYMKKHSWKPHYLDTKISAANYIAQFPGLTTRQIKALTHLANNNKLTNGIYESK